ncbi:hypothetical protein PoB_006956200 [Plakobranchus ocellatus]|uniref:Uncharacterized protein n=1 Tax=Plakobranchus ocellatus TaxID=259542 RepID=A0AAV4DGE4_9GAST|nr:hypothetical protein PoB_006956200 [Plakobranchus ocellatus]
MKVGHVRQSSTSSASTEKDQNNIAGDTYKENTEKVIGVAELQNGVAATPSPPLRRSKAIVPVSLRKASRDTVPLA